MVPPLPNNGRPSLVSELKDEPETLTGSSPQFRITLSERSHQQKSKPETIMSTFYPDVNKNKKWDTTNRPYLINNRVSKDRTILQGKNQKTDLGRPKVTQKVKQTKETVKTQLSKKTKFRTYIPCFFSFGSLEWWYNNESATHCQMEQRLKVSEEYKQNTH